MGTLWITYAWADNKDNDVDFVAQELTAAGLTVKLDRWEIRAGERLWPQIEKFIQDKSQSDAWMMYATANSLGSEPCREEFAYALDRALNLRGNTFPIIGVFPASVDKDLIPAGIRTRLFVSIKDPDWKERIVAAVENRSPTVNRPVVNPFKLTIHRNLAGENSYAVEVRPRAGTWSPFVASIPIDEKDSTNANIGRGPAGTVPKFSVLHGTNRGPNQDQSTWVMKAQDEATPTQSYFLHCKQLPSNITFGQEGGPLYSVDLNK